jgi:outer membrane immunogenic protein
MKKILLATIAFAALAAPAFGADVGARPYYDTTPPAYAAPIYSWTGFYVGGHIGGAFSSSNNFNGLVLSDNSARLLGGVQVGGDWQFHPNFLIGVEGQYSWLGNNQLNAAFPGGLIYNNDQRAIASITGRVGWTWGPGLVYVKGGYAYSDNNETLTTLGGVPVGFALDSDHRDGFTVGAGIEYMFAPNWSAKAEYMFTHLDSKTYTLGALAVDSGTAEFSSIKVGVNYHFR